MNKQFGHAHTQAHTQEILEIQNEHSRHNTGTDTHTYTHTHKYLHAGKSTTFKILTGEILPDEGDARIADHSILLALQQARQRLGYCPQVGVILCVCLRVFVIWTWAH
jgi:hypothetical protein